MSEDYTINVDEFVGKELEAAIAMLTALPLPEGTELDTPDKFKNKAEQGAFINQLVAIHGLRPKKATEADLAAIAALAEEGVQEGEICLVAVDYTEVVPTVEEEEKNEPEEKKDTPAAKSNEPEANQNSFFRGEAVVNTQNRIINGKLYVEVRTVSATYTVTPAEFKEGVKQK